MATIMPAQIPGRERNRVTSKVPCPWADPAPWDSYAPVHFHAQCTDATGYKRRAHAFVVEGRDGLNCLWCGKANTGSRKSAARVKAQ